MSNSKRVKVRMQSTESSEYFVTTKVKGSEKLEVKSYDRKVKKHVPFKEAKLAK